jgi:hypothetical protein
LSGKYGILYISQPYGTPWPLTGIVLSYLTLAVIANLRKMLSEFYTFIRFKIKKSGHS